MLRAEIERFVPWVRDTYTCALDADAGFYDCFETKIRQEKPGLAGRVLFRKRESSSG